MEASDCVIGGGEKGKVDEGIDNIDVQVLLEMSGVFSVLVGDIFLNIMSRVPLKSLSQCRWVCKSWYKLIKSPSFAKIQYEWAVKNNSPWLFFWSCMKYFYLVDDQVFDHLPTLVTAHNLELKNFKQAFQTKFFGGVFEIIGQANGLLCFNTNHGFSIPSFFYICNPITREHITIQKPLEYTDEKTAFGFDPTTDEYKVICFSQYKDKDGKYFLEAEVYTLGSSQWRKIEDVPQVEITAHSVLLKGNLYWRSYVSGSQTIVAFSVSAEKFSVIQLPPGMNQKGHSFECLKVVDEHLCVFMGNVYYEDDKAYEIWVMEDYRGQCSWVKKYSLYSNSIQCICYGSSELVKLRNGEFLVHYNPVHEFIAYFNPEKDTIRPIRVIRPAREKHYLEFYFRSVVQVGSLFSPKAVGNQERKKLEHRKVEEH